MHIGSEQRSYRARVYRLRRSRLPSLHGRFVPLSSCTSRQAGLQGHARCRLAEHGIFTVVIGLLRIGLLRTYTQIGVEVPALLASFNADVLKNIR